MLTLDASLLVAAALPDEPGHEAAAALLRAVGHDRLAVHVPSIAIVEVASGIARRTGDVRLAEDAVRLLLGLPGATFHDLDLPGAVQAAGVATALRLRAADALYAAVAHEARCRLVALDQELIERAAPLVDACTLADWLARRVA